MNDCVFCKIIEGKKSCYKIYEDNLVSVFLDNYPVVDGYWL